MCLGQLWKILEGLRRHHRFTLILTMITDTKRSPVSFANVLNSSGSELSLIVFPSLDPQHISGMQFHRPLNQQKIPIIHLKLLMTAILLRKTVALTNVRIHNVSKHTSSLAVSAITLSMSVDSCAFADAMR